MQTSVPLTPAEQMKRIREIVLKVDETSSQEAYQILASHFSRMDTLRKHIEELESKMLVQEPLPGSRLPIIGPLMHRLRAIAYHTILRWYIVPMLAQQIQFNMGVTQAMREMIAMTESVSKMVKVIDARVTHLEATVEIPYETGE